MTNSKRILRLDASANPGQSASRKLGDRLLEHLESSYPDAIVRERDLNRGLAPIDSRWVDANLSPQDARDDSQRERLRLSDELIDELQSADHIVLTTPMYNFGPPSTLKAWIDLICRAGITFRYTPDGPRGLLRGKRADIIITTGGVALDSPVDFLSGYLRQIFSFIGIDDVNVISADRMTIDAASSYRNAERQIERRYAAVA